MFQYSAIKLSDDFNSYVDGVGNPIKKLDKLSKVNIFVGPNNSGKSRFLRLLSMIRGYQFDLSNDYIDTLNVHFQSFKNEISEYIRRNRLEGIGEISLRRLSASGEIEWLAHSSEDLDEIRTIFKAAVEIPEAPPISGPPELRQYTKPFADKIREIGNTYLTALNNLFYNQPEPYKVYLPILRGLRCLNLESQDKSVTDFYEMRTVKDYYPDNEKKPQEIFTGQKLFDEAKRMLLGDRVKRDSIATYERFLSTQFFENKPVTLIPKIDDDVLHIRIGEEEYAIYNEGDGIQALILITFPLFKAETRTLFFIEEPETHLHPGMQRKLIELLCSDSNDHQFFLTTHSNHFLDLTFDYSNISVYSFRKGDGINSKYFRVETVSSGEDNLLKNLGVRTSSVFLTNCTIWVEGVTDRWYYRKFLDEYQNSPDFHKTAPRFKEDVHFAFVEYGGSNITHWSFLDKEEHPINVDRLCGKSLLIADEDGLKKIQRLKQLEEKLGGRFTKPNAREVENLLSPREIYSVLKEYEKREFNFNIDHELYRHESLGSFIDSYFLTEGGSTRRTRGKYSAESGTISDKVNFCEKALKAIKWETMTKDAKDIAKSIYDFIKGQNL